MTHIHCATVFWLDGAPSSALAVSPILVVAVLVVLFMVNSLVEVATSMVGYSVIPEDIIGRTTGFSRLIEGLSGFLSAVVIAVLDPWMSSDGAFVLLVTRARSLGP